MGLFDPGTHLRAIHNFEDGNCTTHEGTSIKTNPIVSAPVNNRRQAHSLSHGHPINKSESEIHSHRSCCNLYTLKPVDIQEQGPDQNDPNSSAGLKIIK